MLHITSLPSEYGIGDLGPYAYKFADFLAEAKQSFWQVLPLNPPASVNNSSPYSSSSAFAGNTLLISPEKLVEEGYLSDKQIARHPKFSLDRVEPNKITDYKQGLFNIAFENFRARKAPFEYEQFCVKNAKWIDDFSLFMALSEYFKGQSWDKWPKTVRDRKTETVNEMHVKLKDHIDREKFLQYVFFKQWSALKKYCNLRSIQIIGDISLYVDYNCADVWVNPHLFRLDDNKLPAFVSGVPPDYFSKTGQKWGNPVYNWEVMKKEQYSWWIERIAHNLKLFDHLRIDHFRGFVQYWEVPAGEKTAVNGKWVDGPGEGFFLAMLKRFASLPIIAEDLGTITPDVREFVNHFHFPGMKVLLFAFDETLPRNLYAPHNIITNCHVYTGTHDNNTVRGWFENEASKGDKNRLKTYLGHKIKAKTLNWDMIRLAMMSVGNTVIIPMQDILGLGERARMNNPANRKGNWLWRFRETFITKKLAKKLAQMTKLYGRD